MRLFSIGMIPAAPNCSSKPAFKIQVQAVTFLVWLTLFMELQTWPVNRWENQHFYKELFQPIIELLTFSPPLPLIFLTRIPYKPSNSLILFHLQSVSFYHATLRYTKLTPCLSPSITTDPLHPNPGFLLKIHMASKAKDILCGLKKPCEFLPL